MNMRTGKRVTVIPSSYGSHTTRRWQRMRSQYCANAQLHAPVKRDFHA
ncbi:hypothetical protein BIFGAL_03382 [Bifidobacterium gallicum DSM 20093 = LMG 11596]|uniref:Uncharacterized protein n=1 Tax=Bifidobacterium gallicum DSM 20093 = LMG 11596 TaxID=561180 RepID=D1NU61_9BIFI|nr:hypothetical protein BIFGAL_03382 [Bifidobacterium gallicum DSM 20093 = LMG 11596]